MRIADLLCQDAAVVPSAPAASLVSVVSTQTPGSLTPQRAAPRNRKNAATQYECPYPGCTRTSAEASNIRAHMRTHTGETPYACHCGKRFRWKSSLSYHQKARHSKVRPHSCNACGKSFIEPRKLALHKDWCAASRSRAKTAAEHAASAMISLRPQPIQFSSVSSGTASSTCSGSETPTGSPLPGVTSRGLQYAQIPLPPTSPFPPTTPPPPGYGVSPESAVAEARTSPHAPAVFENDWPVLEKQENVASPVLRPLRSLSNADAAYDPVSPTRVRAGSDATWERRFVAR